MERVERRPKGIVKTRKKGGKRRNSHEDGGSFELGGVNENVKKLVKFLRRAGSGEEETEEGNG